MCRCVEIIALFKLPSVDVRLGANEATGDAVRVRLSSSSNKGEDPQDTPADEHSRANVLRVLYFLRQCVEPPVRFNLGGGG